MAPVDQATEIRPNADHVFQAEASVRAWRGRAVQVILVLVAGMGLASWGSVIFNALRAADFGPLHVIYLAVYLAIIILALLPRLDYRLRAAVLLLLVYVNGLASFGRLGLLGSGRLYLLANPLLATLLIGRGAGLATAALSLLTYAVFAWLAYAGLINELGPAPGDYFTDVGSVIESITAFMVFTATLVLLTERFQDLTLRVVAAGRQTLARLVQATTALRESEERLRLVLQATQDGIWDWDVRSDSVYFSPRWKEMLGYGEGELPGRYETWRTLVHPEDWPRTEAALQAYLGGAGSSYQVQHRLRHKDGSYRVILARGVALRDREGRPYRMVGSHADITERELAQQALREREASLASLLQNAENFAIYQLAIDAGPPYFGRMVLVSPSLQKILGIQEPFRFEAWYEQMHPDDRQRVLEASRRAVETCSLFSDTFRIYQAARQRYAWVHCASAPVCDASGKITHFNGLMIDVTEQKQAEEALKAAYQGLEQRVQERTRELAALNTIAAVVSQSLDLKEILGAALDKVLEITGLEFGGAWRIDTDAEGRMERQALVCRGLSPAFVEYAARSSPSPRVVTLTAPTGRPVVWEVAQADETYELKQILIQEGVCQVISIPLMAKGRLVGSMPLGTAQVRTFAPELLSLLAAIGQQVGMAVDNARLFEAERVQHQESERRRLVAESLREYLKVLNSDLPLAEVLDHIVAQAGRLLGSEAVALFQLQPARQVLTIQASRGLDAEYVAGLVVPVGQGAVGRAVATRRPVILRPDAAASKVVPPDVEPERRPSLGGTFERYSVLVGVPLVLKTEVYGALALYYRHDRELSSEELVLVSTFADQAALAIDNARLRERAESSAIAGERTRLSRELHDSVTQSLYSVTMFAEAAARMLATGRTDDAVDSLQALRDTAQEALRGMRLLIFQLRPPAIEKHGLAGALQARLDAVENRAGLRAELSVSGGDQLARLPLGCQVELYHIAQEALNNALKHAHARQVQVSLVSDELHTRLTVNDDGRGFEGGPAEASGGVGLLSMRERAQRLRAELQVASAPGKGTQVTVIVRAKGLDGNGAAPTEVPADRALEG